MYVLKLLEVYFLKFDLHIDTVLIVNLGYILPLYFLLIVGNSALCIGEDVSCFRSVIVQSEMRIVKRSAVLLISV